MKVMAKNAETGEQIEYEVKDIPSETVQSYSVFEMSDDEIKKMIDNAKPTSPINSILIISGMYGMINGIENVVMIMAVN